MKLSLFLDDMAIYVNNPKESTKLRSEFNKFESYMVNIKSSIVFLYISNKQLEIEKNPFEVASKTTKYLKLNLTKCVQDLYSKNYKMLLKYKIYINGEIADSNIVKMSVLFKL